MSSKDYLRILDLMIELIDKYGKAEAMSQTKKVFSTFKAKV